MRKLIVIGHARSGKDTLCEQLQKEFGYSFQSSSMYANEKVIFPKLKSVYGYKTLEECFEDRHNHREEWYQIIREYTFNDTGRLAREIFTHYDIYCGMRRDKELQAFRSDPNVIVIWVEATQRVKKEGRRSCTVTKGMADVIVMNNKTRADFRKVVRELGEFLKTPVVPMYRQVTFGG